MPSPLTYTSIDFRKTGVTTSASLINLNTPYGSRAFQVVTGTGINNGLILGQQDETLTINDIGVRHTGAGFDRSAAGMWQ